MELEEVVPGLHRLAVTMPAAATMVAAWKSIFTLFLRRGDAKKKGGLGQAGRVILVDTVALEKCDPNISI